VDKKEESRDRPVTQEAKSGEAKTLMERQASERLSINKEAKQSKQAEHCTSQASGRDAMQSECQRLRGGRFRELAGEIEPATLAHAVVMHRHRASS
jgi:hypothetical protein